MRHFVILYHRRTGYSSTTEMPDSATAMSYRFDLEKAREKATTPRDWEVAVINAESFDAVRKNHSRYFARFGPVPVDENMLNGLSIQDA